MAIISKKSSGLKHFSTFSETFSKALEVFKNSKNASGLKQLSKTGPSPSEPLKEISKSVSSLDPENLNKTIEMQNKMLEIQNKHVAIQCDSLKILQEQLKHPVAPPNEMSTKLAFGGGEFNASVKGSNLANMLIGGTAFGFVTGFVAGIHSDLPIVTSDIDKE